MRILSQLYLAFVIESWQIEIQVQISRVGGSTKWSQDMIFFKYLFCFWRRGTYELHWFHVFWDSSTANDQLWDTSTVDEQLLDLSTVEDQLYDSSTVDDQLWDSSATDDQCWY